MTRECGCGSVDEVPAATDPPLLLLVFIGAVLMGLVPAWRAYRNTLADGLAPRL